MASRRLVRAPIYQQLNRALREMIRSGEFHVGDRFLTERQVCEQFGVSRATANKALSNLVTEGVLEFKKGVGTFVRGGILDYDLRALVSFTEKAAAAGKTPSTRVLECETLAAEAVDAEIARALRLRPEDELHYMERLRLADGVAVILEHRYVVAHFCPGLAAADLEKSLYATWIDRFKLDISGAEQTIRAVSIRGKEARLLGVRSGSAGLAVLSVGYLSGEAPLWWERTLYRGDAYEFRNRLGPVQTARPATGALRDLEAQAGSGSGQTSEVL
jgi:GntR family transcriptional regulator